MKTVRKYFVTGSLIVLPVFITLLLFLWLFKLLDGILGRYINNYLMSQYGYIIPGLGIIFTLIIILLAGFLATHLINRRILSLLERWFIKFPLVKQIYPAAKQIVYFLFTNPKIAFGKVVLVEFPRKGIYALGFITNDSCKLFNEKLNKELVNVFIPTTPSPLTGCLIFIPKEEAMVVDISTEDALKMIISGGVLNPVL
jgi:uncharacterized membrane protein